MKLTEETDTTSNALIMLPDDPAFNQWLGIPPPDWKGVAQKTGNYSFVTDSWGMLRATDGQGCREYLLGGEYEERLSEMYEPEDEGFLEEDDLNCVEELYIDW